MNMNKAQLSIDKAKTRPSFVEVDLDRLTENYRRIVQHIGEAEVMPIVKANGYGHGMVEVSQHLVALGAKQLGVAFVEEGLALRNSGIQVPILVLGGILGDQIPIFLENNLMLTASSVEKLQTIDKIAGEMGVVAKVHLKIDTGMERIGVHYYSAESLLEASLKVKNIEVAGIFSHFANADADNLDHARLQLARFKEVLSFYEKRGLQPPTRHIANSGAILQLPESTLDMVRPGILLFGVYPSAATKRSIQVKPVLSWKSRVVYFKVVQPDHPVSYGSIWQSKVQTRVVTIPLGYGDGYFRSMTGKAKVLIHGKSYSVVGRICMDQFMVNINWDSAYNNDEVVLIGQSGEETISVEDLAEWANTIPYEILTNINTRVPRVYVNGLK